MKHLLKYLMLFLLIGTTGLTISCKEDDSLENVISKGHGSLKLTLLNGTDPVKNTKVVITDAHSGAKIQTLVSDSNGGLSVDPIIEGNYRISFENETPYAIVYKEVQVTTGEPIESIIQVQDYVGSLTYRLLELSSSSTSLVKYDFGLGIGLVPKTGETRNLLNNEQLYDLAIVKKFEDGIAYFNNLPTGSYEVYKVAGDSIVSDITNYFTVEKGDEEILNIHLNEIYEKLFSKSLWKIKAAYGADGVLLSDFPADSLKLYKAAQSYYNDSYELIFKDGNIFSNYFNYNLSSNSYSMGSDNGSSASNISLYVRSEDFAINKEGEIVMNIYNFEVYDYNLNSYVYDYYNVQVVLE